jgi:phage tail sheath protein FI
VDKGVTSALIDIMKTEGNNFIKELIQEGALLPGSSIIYSKTDNSPSNIGAGKIAFRRVYAVTTPAEDIIFYDVIDVSLYGNI